MSFAYRDRYGVLHGTDDYLTAVKHSRDGRISQTDLPCSDGYLKINDEIVVDYGDGDIYLGGNKIVGRKIDSADVAEYLRPIWHAVGIE